MLWGSLLEGLSHVHSVTVRAGVVELEVPAPDISVPAALMIVTQHLGLLGGRIPAGSDRNLSCFCARCEPTFEGVC